MKRPPYDVTGDERGSHKHELIIERPSGCLGAPSPPPLFSPLHFPPPLFTPLRLCLCAPPPMPTDAAHVVGSKPSSFRASGRRAGLETRVYDEGMGMESTEESLTSFPVAASSKPRHALHSLVDQVTSSACGPEPLDEGVHEHPEYEDIPASSFSDPGHYAFTRSSTSPMRVAICTRSCSCIIAPSPPPARAMRPLPPIPGSATPQFAHYQATNNIVGSPSSANGPPPPLPLKSDLRYKSKTVSIVTPSDYSHQRLELTHTVSEPDHSSAYTTSDRTPFRKVYGAQYSSGQPPYSSRLSWADKTHVPLYRNSCSSAAMNAPTAVPFPVPKSLPRGGRNRLRKPPPQPRSSLHAIPSSSPSSFSRFLRALSLRDHSSSSEASPSSSSPPSRPPSQRPKLDGTTHDLHSRPTPRPSTHSYNCGSDSSAGHTSNTSASTSLTTPLTSPDSASPPVSPIIVSSPQQGLYSDDTHVSSISPVLLPQLVHSPPHPRKLKKRPPAAPSSTSHLLLDSTNSPSKTQQPRQRNAGEYDGFLPPLSPEAPFRIGIVGVLLYLLASCTHGFSPFPPLSFSPKIFRCRLHRQAYHFLSKTNTALLMPLRSSP